jgi:hypothetical protein
MLSLVNRHLFRTFFASFSSFWLFFITNISFSFVFFQLFCIWNLFNGTKLFKLELVRVFIHQPAFLTVLLTFLLLISLKTFLVLSTFLLQRLIKSIFFKFSHFFDFAFQCHVGFLEILNVLVIHFIHIYWFQQLVVVRNAFAALKIVMILFLNFLVSKLVALNILILIMIALIIF